jgi:hypothetical protein
VGDAVSVKGPGRNVWGFGGMERVVLRFEIAMGACDLIVGRDEGYDIAVSAVLIQFQCELWLSNIGS